MNAAQLFYIINILIYAGVDIIACLGLSQQFGVAGVTNFGYIIFQAAGAYTAAILSMPSDTSFGGFQSYIGGLNLPFPLPWIGGALAGAAIALPFTFLVGRRLRGDFAAVGLLVTAVMFNLLVTDYRPLFNGSAGLSLVPAPLQSAFNPQGQGYQWAYAAGALLLAAAGFWLVRRLTESPYGRSLRAMRENDTVADSLGKNLTALRAGVLMLGGAFAGLSGAVLVGFINLWAPSAWGYAETIVLFGAVIIGGAGSHRGAVLGAILVPVGFEEATRFIPPFGPPGLVADLQWVAIGLLVVIFLWLRPQGILPERRRLVGAAFAQPQNPHNDQPERTVAAPDQAPASSPASSVVDRAGEAARASPNARSTPSGEGGEDVKVRDAVLRAEGVEREFGGVRAVAGVSLEVRRGTLTGLIGPNGSGKSTLLKALTGVVRLSTGRVMAGERDITGLPPEEVARAGVGYVPQVDDVFAPLTVRENLVMGGYLLGRREVGARVDRVLTVFPKLAPMLTRRAGKLSGGERKMLAMGRVLMLEPAVFLLDEPTANLAPQIAAELLSEHVRALAEAGAAVLIVEQRARAVLAISDHTYVLGGGQVLMEGTPAELSASPAFTESFLGGTQTRTRLNGNFRG